MPIILDGTGTISGLVAGGLPDETITAADLATGAVNAQALTLFNASGSAPVFACRAWVNFNGTGTVAIRASGNVSSITDNSVGNYTVNFTTAMPDINFAFLATCGAAAGGGSANPSIVPRTQLLATTSAIVLLNAEAGGVADLDTVSVSIFR